MESAPLAVARRAQGPQPGHDVFDPRFHHIRILSILCERDVAFEHRYQKTSGFSGFHIAANRSVSLSFSQSGGNALPPRIEHFRKPLAEPLVKGRHFLSQIVQGTAAPYVLGPN